MYLDLTGDEHDWRHAYKVCIGLINPRPIALVSTVSADGITNLAPFSFFNMVCANPPVLIFCPGRKRDGAAKDTLVNVQATREFTVAIVTDDIARPMVDCAAALPPEQSEFDFAGLTPLPATRIQSPLVKQARANLECTLRELVPIGQGAGSSCVVFGDIVAIHIADEVLDDDQIPDPRKLKTVGRLGGQWYAPTRNPFEMSIPPAEKA